MSIKNLVFSFLLAIPLYGGASTLTEFTSLSGSSDPNVSSYTNTGGTTVTTFSTDEFFVDLWTLDVGENDTASINFEAKNLSVTIGSSTVDMFKISPFTVSALGNYGLTDLGTGKYNFLVSGTTSGLSGGLYLVGTAITAVPLPAAVWLFGTALLGVLSISKRKHQI